MNPEILATVIGILLVTALTWLLQRSRAAARALERDRAELQERFDRLRQRFAPVVNIDDELLKVRTELATAKLDLEEFVRTHEARKTAMATEYQSGSELLSKLRAEVSLLEENLEDISYGLYKPHYGYHHSDQYKRQLDDLRNRERAMIRGGQAAVCSTRWQVGGSAKEGERMAKQSMKLLLRAFNGECDAALANVSWNNIVKMEERIRKSYEAINQLGTVTTVSITEQYLQLKLSELRLTFEYERKRYEEKEEQRRIREQMREEERVQREIERAREEAEKEEGRYEKALARAREEAAKATGEKLDRLKERIAELDAQLQKAHELKQRAVSRAQMTKSGHVYVVSNIGSFGEEVFKIGMTRRLVPEERVAELGDASVPFPFDVHAMIYSENAPELESALHAHLTQKRLNLVNLRKEFFQTTLEELGSFVQQRGLAVEFTRMAEAREYRETLSLREAAARVPPTGPAEYPAELFPGVASPGVAAQS